MLQLPIVKLAAICLFLACLYVGCELTGNNLGGMFGLSKRMSVLNEVRLIDKLMTFYLVDKDHSVPIVMKQFCNEHLGSSCRDTSLDFWSSPYCLFLTPTSLYKQSAIVQLGSEDMNKIMVVSAGKDKKFITRDDITSKGDKHQVMKCYFRTIKIREKKRQEGEPAQAFR